MRIEPVPKISRKADPLELSIICALDDCGVIERYNHFHGKLFTAGDIDGDDWSVIKRILKAFIRQIEPVSCSPILQSHKASKKLLSSFRFDILAI